MFHIVIMQIRTIIWGLKRKGYLWKVGREQRKLVLEKREREVALIIMDLFR